MARSFIAGSRRFHVPVLAMLALVLLVGCPPAEDPPWRDDPQPDPSPPGQPGETAIRGIEFRATGPDWLLEIERDGRLLLTTEPGPEQISVPAPLPVRDVARGIWSYEARSEEEVVRVEIREGECTDITTGERLEAAVFIEVRDRDLQGCGEWLIEQPP